MGWIFSVCVPLYWRASGAVPSGNMIVADSERQWQLVIAEKKVSTQDRWQIIQPDQIHIEIERLRAMSPLDRKLDLMCHPIAMDVDGLLWQYINAIHEPEGYGGSFVAIAMGKSNVDGIVRVVSINNEWQWSVYIGGMVLSGRGEASDLLLSMRECLSCLQEALPMASSSNDCDILGVVPSGLDTIGIAAQSWA